MPHLRDISLLPCYYPLTRSLALITTCKVSAVMTRSSASMRSVLRRLPHYRRVELLNRHRHRHAPTRTNSAHARSSSCN